MANYSLADIKALREKTGAGMMDVKKALDEADGDTDKALEIIRVKGLKGVGKREGRAASDGLVAAHVGPTADGEGQTGVLVEINSETDFVAKSPNFVALADRVLAAAVDSPARDADALLATEVDGTSVQTIVDETAATLGERVVVRRLARVAGEHVEVYLHKVSKDLPPAGRRARRDRRGRRRRRPGHRDAHRGVLARRTSRARRSRPTSSRTSATSPRRRPATRASPRPRCRRSSRAA